MLKQKIKKLSRYKRLLGVLAISAVIAGSTAIAGIARADQYDDQINALQQQNASNQEVVDSLASQASDYQSAINALQTQIDGIQQGIVLTQNKIDDLTNQINQAQDQLTQQKKVLGEDIKTMYLEGQTSTLEILAASKNLNQFVDEQEYRYTVQNKIKTTVDKINTLKLQLQEQQREQQGLLQQEEDQRTQLQTSQDQQNQMLAYNEQQQTSYTQQIQTANAQIVQLRAEQLAANKRLVGSGNVNIVSTGSCGGGYPADAVNASGLHWGCNYAQDNTIDNWGMDNRECVSYTAFKVWQAYGYMPFWGGVGNADEWPGDADAAGIPRGNAPKVGSVAIGTNSYYFGSVGHAMWVEQVSGDQILVSQYNFSAPGQYSEMWINTNLISTFIYFGG